MPLQTRLVLFLIVGGVGAFLIGAYLGLYSWPRLRSCRAIFCDPYHWQILAIGIAFFCAGLAYLIPPGWKLVGKINGALVVGALLAGIVGAFAAR